MAGRHIAQRRARVRRIAMASAMAVVAVLVPASAPGAAAAAGRLDPTFGVRGRVLLPEVQVPIYSSVWAMAVQADDSIVAVGKLGRLAVRLRPDGSLDPAFHAPEGEGIDVALQGDERIVVATASGLVRLLADGSLDRSFTTDPQPAYVRRVVVTPTALFSIESDAASGTTLVRRTMTGAIDVRFGDRGRIVLGGTCDSFWCGTNLAVASGDRPVVFTDGDVRRYRATGALDPAFAPVSVPPPPEAAYLTSLPVGVGIAVDEQDRVVVASLDDVDDDVARVSVRRFDARGGADPALDLRIDVDSEDTVPWYLEEVDDVAVHGHQIAIALTMDMVTRDLSADYVGPDVKWGTLVLDDRGRQPWSVIGTSTGLGDGDRNNAVGIDKAGRVITGGRRGRIFVGGIAEVDRFQPDGTPDGSFGVAGSAAVRPTTTDLRVVSPDASAEVQIRRGPKQTLMVAATSTADANPSSVVQRFQSGGRLDSRYGDDGTAIADLEPLGAFAVAPDASAVIARDDAIVGLSASGVPSGPSIGPGGTRPADDFGPRAYVGSLVPDGAGGFVLAGADIYEGYWDIVYTAFAWRYHKGTSLRAIALDQPSRSRAESVVLLPTGSFVMDRVDDSGAGLGLVRFTIAGEDHSFVTAGDLRGPLGVDGAGRVYAVSSAHAVVRVLVNGSIDPSFTIAPLADQPQALGVDSRGRVVVLAADGTVHRYLLSGAPDRSFGSAGVATIAGATLVDLVLDAHDRPVVVGALTPTGREAMWRLTA